MTRATPGPGIPPEAVSQLRRADPVLAGIIDRIGEFEPYHEPDLWRSLVDAIVSQQLSIRAAATIVGRVAATSSNGFPTPEEILALEEEVLRTCGLSRAKVAYVRDLARRWLDGSLDPDRIPDLEDEAIIAELTQVKGIGRWTAEMALIFTLRRPDVLPVDDLGFRTAVQRAYGMDMRPKAAELRALAEPWRPFRSIATLYLWRSLKL
jgi:DNA-3-methyladenine glycosylase II